MLLTDRLAAKLGVRPGDRVWIEVLEGEPRRVALEVGGTVRDMMGLNAYIDRNALNQALGDGDLGGGHVLAVQRGREAEVLAATQGLPRVAGAFSKATMVRNMQEISARNVRIMSSILTVFASVIAVGVVYNNARIVLAERGWELASLRVLGFTRAEVSAMLLGEMAITIAVALPLARLAGSQLRLIHVVNEQSIVIGAEGFPSTSAEVIALLREGGQAILAAARQRAEAAGLPVDVQMREVFGSRIGDSVLEEAANWPADLIVIGTHGRRGLRRLVLGSDAEHILRNAPVPVLLVRGE